MFAVLIALILGGNGLLIWQFQSARRQTERLTTVNRQLIAVQRLREGLLIFHRNLDEAAHSKDAGRLETEAERSLRSLLQQTQETQKTLTRLPAEIPVDPLEAIEISLPSQLEDISALARAGDWEATDLRLTNQLKPMEIQTSALVTSIDHQVVGEMAQAVANMASMQHRILLIVPATALLTFFVAAFFSWSIARGILELRMQERAKERARIARELHDGVLQQLTSVTLWLETVKYQLPPDSQARTHIGKLKSELIRVGTDIRRLSHELRPTALEEASLPEALSVYCTEFIRTRGIFVTCSADRGLQALSSDSALCLFRIAQEALGNVAKHANAKKVEIRLTRSDSNVCLSVSDDGVGCATNRIQEFGGLGLTNMRERVRQLQGTLEFESEPGHGTTVRAKVPLQSVS
jgi:signal transduction histidine kinase